MTAREEIDTEAILAGWDPVPARDAFYQEYMRPAKVNPGKLAKIAEVAGWVPHEAVWVRYTDNGSVVEAVRRTPHEQAAIDGHFVGFSEETRGRNRKGQVIAWLVDRRQY